MKYIIACVCVATIFFSCKAPQGKAPGAPASPEAVKKVIAGKTFVTSRVGTLSPFAGGMDKDKPYQWFDEEKEPARFTRDYEAERMKFVLAFVNDTLVRITDDGKTWDAVYLIDGQTKEDEKPGIRIRFSYEDKEGSMSFPGATSPMLLTSSYLVTGSSTEALILQAPREFNRHKLMLWMKPN